VARSRRKRGSKMFVIISYPTSHGMTLQLSQNVHSSVINMKHKPLFKVHSIYQPIQESQMSCLNTSDGEMRAFLYIKYLITLADASSTFPIFIRKIYTKY
jgi:hypothetical protein